MTRSKPGDKAGKKSSGPTETREDRLKAALKANLNRRKRQARARAQEPPDDNEKTR
jgi:hypothetical protein